MDINQSVPVCRIGFKKLAVLKPSALLYKLYKESPETRAIQRSQTMVITGPPWSFYLQLSSFQPSLMVTVQAP